MRHKFRSKRTDLAVSLIDNPWAKLAWAAIFGIIMNILAATVGGVFQEIYFSVSLIITVVLSAVLGWGAGIVFAVMAGLGGLYHVVGPPGFEVPSRPIDLGRVMMYSIGSTLAILATSLLQRRRALMESEFFYRQTLESIPGMVFTTRPDGFCDYQSQQWVEYTGVPMEEHLGDGWNRLLHPDDRPAAYRAWRDAVEGRADYNLEYRVRRYDGRYEWFKVLGRPIKDSSGRIVKWFGVAANIDAIKRAQEELRASEEKFRGTFENAVVGMTHVDAQGNWMEVNDTFCKMIGYSREALLNTNFSVLTFPEDVEEDRKRFQELISGKIASYSAEKRYVRKDGSVLWVILSRAVQRDSEWHPKFVITVVVDITKRKKAEESLLRLKNELQNKNQELESIIGVVSHDLRSPLVNVKGFAKEIKDSCRSAKEAIRTETTCERMIEKVAPVLEETVPESVEFINTSANAMSQLVESLVQVGRAGLVVLKPEKLNMNELTETILANFEIRIKQKDVLMAVGEMPECYSDRTQTTQILSNLIDNAIKYLDPKRPGTIQISGQRHGDEVIYCVQDNGLGIPKSKQERVFDIFYRMHREAAGGEGIGLAMVKRMVDRNNGRIWFESEEGKGSKFCVVLPA